MRHGDLKLATADGPAPGHPARLADRPDGIGGASVLASATFGGPGEGHAASGQRPGGRPFLEKLLIECCLELYRDGLVTGIQDLGAAGVACATTELAAAGTGGMRSGSTPCRCATRRSGHRKS